MNTDSTILRSNADDPRFRDVPDEDKPSSYSGSPAGMALQGWSIRGWSTWQGLLLSAGIGALMLIWMSLPEATFSSTHGYWSVVLRWAPLLVAVALTATIARDTERTRMSGWWILATLLFGLFAFVAYLFVRNSRGLRVDWPEAEVPAAYPDHRVQITGVASTL